MRIQIKKIMVALIRVVLVVMGFPGGSDSKASAYNAKDLHSIPGLGKSPGEGKGYPLQYSCLSLVGYSP